MPWRHRMPGLRADRGSILPLVLGYGVIALVLVLLVTAATSLYLEKKCLFTLADGAALVGAESFELADVVVARGEVRPVLEPAAVRDAAGEYLSAAPTERFEALRVEEATTRDGLSATVSLSAVWRPPVVTLFLPEGLRIDATATARSVFG